VPVVSSDGVDIHVLDEGEGQPVLLIHGFASNAVVNWVDTGWVRHLNRSGFRAIAMDNRGHGLSGKLYTPQEYGTPRMAEDARRVLDHLGIGRADVMGYSMGARIAAFLAIQHPQYVRSVVFGGLGVNMVRPMAGTGPIAAALEAPTIDDVTNPTARTFRAFADSTKSDLKALAACIRGARDPISADDLKRLQCPVLVAVGSTDVIAGSATDLAGLIPGAQAVVMEGRDHMKAVGDRAYKDAVIEFLNARP
jgi:pimeloyl-ACP methyl ester carboxylesterase